MAEREWTIGGLLQWTEQFLAQNGVESPRLDAQILLAYALGCDRIHLYTRFDEPSGEGVRTNFRELVRRRVEGCPVAYLVGRKEFFSLELEVGPAVLIPRPDTECLVIECLRLARGLPNDWQCRAGSRYLYVCEDGLVHYCSQQRGYPAVPLAKYTLADL